MSFFSNIFGSTSQAANSGPTPPAPPAQPAAPAQPTLPAAPVSPLDSFSSLWEPTPTPSGVDGTLPGNIFAGATLENMVKASRNVDFAKSIPPEMLTKITAGGPEAGAAFQAVINDISQRAYAQSSYAATQIVETALRKFSEGLDTRLPSQIKKHQVSQSIREDNPALVHPAAAPILEALQAQMAVKFPTASVEEIRNQAKQYLVAFNSASNPTKAPAVPVAEDWGKFFG